jgi:glutamine amidotransferase
VQLAFAHLGVAAQITRDPAAILKAERVVFPGVGSAGAARQNLDRLGLAAVLQTVIERGTPFLGICLGTQIVFETLEEDGGVRGLGLIPGTVRRFAPVDPRDKVPQIGWNAVTFRRPHPVLEGIESGSEFYFVHSYYPAPADPGTILGETEYAGARFASIVSQANLLATQFHPEKSGRIGLRLLENFSRWSANTNCH